MINPYKTLAANCSMCNAEIKTLYQRAKQITHPDKGGTVEEFGQVQEAYAAIGTPTKRFALNQKLNSSSNYVTCGLCSMRGWVAEPVRSLKKRHVATPIACPECDGLGYVSHKKD